MRFSLLRLLLVSIVLSGVVACSSGAVSQPPTTNVGPSASVPAAPTTTSYSTINVTPSGGTYSLKLPAGYSGSFVIGPNHAPTGTAMEVGFLAASPGANKRFTTTPPDPFPISFTIRLPFTITLPIPGWTITFPKSVNLGNRTFSVAIFNPNQPINFLGPAFNPQPLGTATASGNTLTFVPAVQKFTFVGGVKYTETIADTTGGGAGSVIPFTAGSGQTAGGANGTLGTATASFTSSTSGLGQSTYIVAGPPLSFQNSGDGTNATGTVSLIFQSSTNTSLTNTTVTIASNPTSSSPPLPGTGNFTPSGPGTTFPATVTAQNTLQFTIPSGLNVGPGQRVILSAYSVTVCVPNVSTMTCDYTNPSNALTRLNPNQQYDVLVSDALSLLTGNYSIKLIATDVNGNPLPGDATGCSFSPESAANADVPNNYTDAVTTSTLDQYGGYAVGPGPNDEFEINTGNPGSATASTCEIQASYNGNVVVDDNWTITSGEETPAIKRAIMHRLLAKPPVNGPHGGTAPGA